MEMRVGLEGQVVGRDVLRAARDRFAHVVERLLQPLDRQCVHEVHVYGGKRLDVWLEEFGLGYENAPPDAIAAIHSLGTNALPFLLKAIQNKKSNWDRILIELSKKQTAVKFDSLVDYSRGVRAACAFRALGSAATSAIPVLTNLLQNGSNHITSAIALAGLGEEGIAPLLQALSSTNSRIRMGAASGLAHAWTRFEQVVPALITALSDREAFVRWTAANTLGVLKINPEVAVPALVATLSDTNHMVRSSAALALGLFGPPATNAVTPLTNLRNDSDPMTRHLAEWALKEIQEPSAEP